LRKCFLTNEIKGQNRSIKSSLFQQIKVDVAEKLENGTEKLEHIRTRERTNKKPKDGDST
jgi:hypothetical protein